MASAAQHQKQWEHNRSFLGIILRQPDYCDWVTAVAFYTALHAVQTALVTHRLRPTSHKARNQLVEDTPPFCDIWKDYKALYDASMASRYDCSGWLSFDRVRDELVRNRLARIEQHVVKIARVSIDLPDLLGDGYVPRGTK
jgi:hypothetical protein